MRENNKDFGGQECNAMEKVPFALYEAMVSRKDAKIEEMHHDVCDRLEDARHNFGVDLEKVQASHEKAVKRWQRACIAISVALIVLSWDCLGR